MPSSSSSVLDLKRRALALKRAGDVDGALQLLRQAKQLEQQQNNNNIHESQEEKEEPNPVIEEQEKKEPPQQDSSIQTNTKEEEQNDLEEGKLEGGNDDNDDLLIGDLLENGGGSVTFTDEEMMDCDLMTEFKLGFMPVPSQDDYQAKILSTKKTALACKKAGNIAGAKEELAKASELEKVRIALSHMSEGLGLRIHDDKDGWLEELSEPDSAMVGNIYGNKGSDAAMVLDLDDLDIMSQEELLDAVEMGMELPALQNVLEAAHEKKTLAVQCKQEGDLDGAKTALLDYKKLQAAATTLQSLQDRKDGLGSEETISMETLESLLDGNNGDKKAPKQPPKQEEPKKAAPPMTAEQLKQEAVRLRNENTMKEATKVFKLYKQALQKEADAAEKKRCQQVIESIRKEILLAQQQQGLFEFYKRFVDNSLGAAQLTWWDAYMKRCKDAIKVLETRKSTSVIVSHTTDSGALKMDQEDLVYFVGQGTNASEERLEVAILNVKNLQDNHAFQKLHGSNEKEGSIPHILRLEVTIQIPPTEQERDKPVELIFESSPCAPGDLEYRFDKPQYVSTPRGDSKFAKTIHRRMERRKIHMSLHHVPHEEKRKKWFGGSTSALLQDKAPTLLGKIALELKDLLKKNCIAGDFSLMSSTRALGGSVGLVMRTGAPFDTDLLEETLPEPTLEPYQAMSFSLASEN